MSLGCKERKKKLWTVSLLWVFFFIFSFSLSFAEPGKEPVSPVNSDRNLIYSLSNSEELFGSWSFVYYKAYQSLVGKNPPPPRFDMIELGKPDSLKLVSRIYETDVTGRYKVSGDVISFSLDMPETESSTIYSHKCSLANHGKAMILESDGIEMIYFRSYRMLKNDIAGQWASENKGKKKSMVLAIDGSCTIEPGKISGFYRRWPSRHGSTITAFLHDPEFGFFVSMWRYGWKYERKNERKGGELVLTVIDKNGELQKPGIVWKQE